MVISSVVLALSCTGAHAQDSSSNPGPVDRSVHAGLEEQPQPEPSQSTAKRPATLSTWSAQPARPSPPASAWSAHTTRSKPGEPLNVNQLGPLDSFQPERRPASTIWPALDQATAGSNRKLGSRPDSFAILSLRHPHDRSVPLVPSLPVFSPPATPEIQGFPGLFEQRHSGPAFDSFRMSLSEGKAAQARRSMGRPKKSGHFTTGKPTESTIGEKP
jgi:hypothetical protein